MWITEFGYPTQGDRSVDRGTQAAYLREAVQILSHYTYARALFVYQLQDWGPRDGDREHYFGVVEPDGAKKPAFATLRKLSGAR
jgi:exo-beta-1,3-glucanase (GH17 family)